MRDSSTYSRGDGMCYARAPFLILLFFFYYLSYKIIIIKSLMSG